MDNVEKIKLYIEKMRNQSTHIHALFTKLESLGEIIIVGGAVRDILFNHEPRDFDLILAPFSPLDLAEHLDCEKQINSFGGIKAMLDNVEFDIWRVQDTWAIREGYFPNEKESLKNLTFFDFDSIYYYCKQEKLEMSFFEKTVETKTIDILFEPNPQEVLCVLRAFAIQKKWGFDFSKRLRLYIKNWALKTENPLELLQEKQMKHYRFEMFSEKEFLEIINKIKSI